MAHRTYTAQPQAGLAVRRPSHLRWVGKDCLVSFDASLYSLPAKQIRAGQRVELRVDASSVTIYALDGTLLASHPRATTRGSWVVQDSHSEGLPDGHTRATVIDPPRRREASSGPVGPKQPLAALLTHRRLAAVDVATRPLSDYAALEAGQR